MAAASAQIDPSGPRAHASIDALASKSLILASCSAGERLVAVGEYGHVLLSDDGGETWRQARDVPTRALLTGVYFADARHGWVVGHDEVILRSDDGGERWQLVHYAPERQRPLLDVAFSGAKIGIAVGAYSAMLLSGDAGETWTPVRFAARLAASPKSNADDLDTEYHLNAIARSASGRWYIAAEAGHLYRSDNNGSTWQELHAPYAGSFYGVLPLDADELLVFGLRGNLYRSSDAGRNWQKIPTGTDGMLTHARRSANSIVIAGLDGALLLSRDTGMHFRLLQQGDRKGLSTVIALRASRTLVGGEAGLQWIDLPP
jgi:photosystem II stability/assembly factor-like uncharacterized protein